MRFFPKPLVLILAFSLIVACTKDSPPTGPTESNGPSGETSDLRQFSDSLIAAFKAGQKSKVLNFVSEESKNLIADALNDSSVDMLAFGSALEQRQMVYGSDGYAVYTITVKGASYHVAYAKCGNWQLVR
jgi:aromatic ring-opening dioxygenase LigB subunit